MPKAAADENNPPTPPVEPSAEPKPTPPTLDDDEDFDKPPAPILDDENLPKPPKLKKSPKGLIVVLVIILVLAVAGAAGWFFLIRPEAKPAQQASTDTTVEKATSNDVAQATNTETYTNDVYRITIKYPKTWTVADEDDGSIMIQSQNFSYETVAKGSKEGNFRIYIRKGATTADSEIIAKGLAIDPSQTLKYTAPAPGQRTETNLSNFGKDEVNNFSFILITSNFVLKKGDTLGPNFGKETDAFIIGGGYSESTLPPGLSTNQVPIEGYNTTNAYKQALAIIQSLEIK